MKNIIVKSFMISMMLLITGCNYSVSLAHTQGQASDVIDDTATASPTVSPSLTIPASVVGK